jgi:hypothetical protein
MSSQPREATHLEPLLALALQIDRGLDVTTKDSRCGRLHNRRSLCNITDRILKSRELTFTAI